MRVLRRIIIKLLLLVIAIVGSAGGRMAYKAHKNSTADAGIQKYLGSLINAENEKAYKMLIQCADAKVSLEDYEKIVKEREYFLFADYHYTETQVYEDEQGHAQADYAVTFVNAADEPLYDETMTFQRAEKSVYGYFDSWKVLSSHCTEKGFSIKTVKDSQVYLNGMLLDDSNSTLAQDTVTEIYQVNSILPLDTVVIVRNPVYASVEKSAVPSATELDLTTELTAKDSAVAACEEMAIQALQSLYGESAKKKTEVLNEIFASCPQSANKIIRAQRKAFRQDGSFLHNLTVSDYEANAQMTDLEEAETFGMSMTLTYSYIQENAMEMDGVDENGNPTPYYEYTQKEGTAAADFIFTYENEAWKITTLDVPVI